MDRYCTGIQGATWVCETGVSAGIDEATTSPAWPETISILLYQYQYGMGAEVTLKVYMCHNTNIWENSALYPIAVPDLVWKVLKTTQYQYTCQVWKGNTPYQDLSRKETMVCWKVDSNLTLVCIWPKWTSNHQCTSCPFCPLDGLCFFIQCQMGFIIVHFISLLITVLFLLGFVLGCFFLGPDLTHSYPTHLLTFINIVPTLVPY